MAANDTPMLPVKGTAALAWVVVLTITAVGLLFIIIAAFSQDNAVTSVDGDASTFSQYIDGDE